MEFWPGSTLAISGESEGCQPGCDDGKIAEDLSCGFAVLNHSGDQGGHNKYVTNRKNPYLL